MDRFKVKQYLKMFMQHRLFPAVYQVGKLRRVKPGLIVFADSHHGYVPYSMVDLWRCLQKKGYKVREAVKDCDSCGRLSGLLFMVRFMLLYARAEYVFLCDNFLPVASCRKREGTKVVQMWHAGGMLKKYGYDTPRDIPPYYKGNVYQNYSLIIASDKNCVPAYVSGMKADPETVKPLGLSRTDRFYQKPYLEFCRNIFFSLYPEGREKKVALWAPTFRGNAGMPSMIDLSFVEQLRQELGDSWMLVVKLHPQLEKKTVMGSCPIPTERLLPVADLLISDYSSVIYDYLLLERPIVLYVPDLEEFLEKDQLYIDYNELPGRIVKDGGALAKAVKEEYEEFSVERLRAFKEKYMSACDGHATERLLEYIGL